MVTILLGILLGALLLAVVVLLSTRNGRNRLTRLLKALSRSGTEEGDLDTPPAHFTGWKWCPLCRGQLELREVCGRTRLACSRRPCQFVHWDNPKPVALAVVQMDDKIVLVRRKVNPAIGSWCLPGGFMEEGESAEEAAIREVVEETGLHVRIDRLLGTFSPCHSVNEIIVVYCATVLGGTMRPDDDADAVEAFGASDCPKDIAFDQHRHIIRDWFESKGIEKTSLTCQK